jgi:DNA helicase-2/ATP-dependent DNA helicase PcrA
MAIAEVLRAHLTDAQRAAAIDPSRHLLCLACAGSGKSRTLAFRLARLLADGEPAESLVAFTFTDKAAESIKRRVAQALTAAGLSPNLVGAMFIGTIHSFCHQILGKIDATYRQFDVLDENRLMLYLMSRYGELAVAPLRARAVNQSYFATIEEVCRSWWTAHEELIALQEIQGRDPELGDTLLRMQALLHRDQFVDFSTMINRLVDLLQRDNPAAIRAIEVVRHLMVDEYQDVSPNQEALIALMDRHLVSLFVVGDDDQSIYAWRGADVSNILNFGTRYADAVQHTLAENFRSTPTIVQVADQLVRAELGPSRLEKTPHAAHDLQPRQFGVLMFQTRAEEAVWVVERIRNLLGSAYLEVGGESRGLTPADFAILMTSTRTPEQSGEPRHLAFSNALTVANIPFSIEAGGGPFDRPQVQVLRVAFGLLRAEVIERDELRIFFDTEVLPSYPAATFDALVRVMTEWGRLVHAPHEAARRRVYPQILVYDLLEAFGVDREQPADEVMRDIGLFSRMMQDVESVYMSVDSAQRFTSILNFLENPAETHYNVTTEEIMLKPDAVTISTVHKVKGLEFPVVFVVDAEQGRVPGRRRTYDGWLPADLMAPALQRGCYQSTANDQARVFYTALTRAERFLYLSASASLPGGSKVWRMTSYAGRLQHAEQTRLATELPFGLQQQPMRRRVDENVRPTSFSDVRYYLRCPMDYRFRQGHGFSPPIPDMFGFGRTVHTAIGKLHERFRSRVPTEVEASATATEVFHLKHVPQSRRPAEAPGPYERARDKAIEITREYARDYGQDFERRREIEARFEISAQDCLISGSIDLLLREDINGHVLDAEVVDFKAMEGGDSPEDNVDMDWLDLSLQVQLYARGAREVLGENARTGSVHLLKDNQRVQVPVTDDAVSAAVANVEWAVSGILARDYPMRPHPEKCSECDFQRICPKRAQPFRFTEELPPAIHIPNDRRLARAFSEFVE